MAQVFTNSQAWPNSSAFSASSSAFQPGSTIPTWLPTVQPNNGETWHSHRHSSSHSCLNQEQRTRNSKACFHSYQCPSPHSHQYNMKSARRTTSNQLPIESLHGPGTCFRGQLKHSARGRMDVVCSWMTTHLWLYGFIFKIMCGTYISFSKPF